MTDIDEWQGKVGESWAREWARTDLGFANLTDRLIEAMAAEPYHSVLDIGCGAGEVSLRLADRASQAHIWGVDVSPALVDAARKRAGERKNVQFYLANAAEWQPRVGEAAPDLLVSRHGVMFFDDPQAAFAHLLSVAAPGARMVFSCFRAPKFSPFFTEVGKLLPPPDAPADPYAPGPFAFADQDRVSMIMSGSGWQDISFEPVDLHMIAGKGEDPVADALEYFQRIGPAARILREVDDVQRRTILQGLENMAAQNCADGVVSLPAGMWIVRAKAP